MAYTPHVQWRRSEETITRTKTAAFGESLYTKKERVPPHLESLLVSFLHLLMDAAWLWKEAIIYSNS